MDTVLGLGVTSHTGFCYSAVASDSERGYTGQHEHDIISFRIV